MADTIQFDLVSPEKLVASQAVDMVVVPGGEGDLGVLPGHSLLIGTVRPGVIDIHEGGKVTDRIFVAGGFVEVNPETCTVLAEEAVPVAEIDKAAASERLHAAQKALADADDAKAKADAEDAVKVAEAMVAAAR
ncbi:MAG: F0F1 ATP synthase subunit epsilon [Rhodospirillales bacterium CG15_BIG_FIL_POST_REV_8_21_14_020_66_15]|nr:MAG: F0F1 ATP synthase subunit epsilon [Rhodospirillales bacterium CG15_BIG_FIL_POST_REV_8_21_14_020_66_15]